MITSRKFIIVEVVLAVLIVGYFIFSNVPNLIYPLNGMVITDPDLVFEIENGENVLISVDEEFSNPIVLGEGDDVTLPPGKYYWKAKNKIRESKVRTFVIEGYVSFEIKERDENYEVQNIGNVVLNVSKIPINGDDEEIILDVGESKQVEKEDSLFEGKQK